MDPTDVGIATLVAANRRLGEILDALKEDLLPSLEDWDDNARIAYLAEVQAWDRSARRQREILGQMPRMMAAAEHRSSSRTPAWA